jgi:hypothetical protein
MRISWTPALSLGLGVRAEPDISPAEALMPTSWESRALVLLGFLAMAWIVTGAIGAIAHTPQSEPALADSAHDETGCNSRDPLSGCFREPERGIPVGDLLVLEDAF